MEILDYLRIARRRAWILIMIPVLAGAAAAGLVIISPPTYTATATVSSNSLVGMGYSQFTGTQGASQFAAAFTASATNPGTLADASRAAHNLTGTTIPSGELASGLTVAEVGASSDMTLTYASHQQTLVVPALRAIVAATLHNMFAPQVNVTQAQVYDAKAQLVGATNPLARKVAVANLTTAQTAYQAARTQLSAANAKGILHVSTAHAVGQTSTLLKTLIPVVGAAVFLAVLLVMILEMVGSTRRAAKSQAAREATATRRRHVETATKHMASAE